MKRHEFFCEIFPQTMLFGLSIAQYESKLEAEDQWKPTFRIEFGFVFFTLSYTKISI